jgi:hypothetical protein
MRNRVPLAVISRLFQRGARVINTTCITVITRRHLITLFRNMWLVLFMAPLKVKAQDCSDPNACPNTYVDCVFLAQTNCGPNPWGRFILGCPLEAVQSIYYDICAWCPNDLYQPACSYQTWNITAMCRWAFVYNSLRICCMANPLCD